MSFKKNGIFALAIGILSSPFAGNSAQAGTFEVSAGFWFNQSTYTEGSYSWTRRWGASVGYNLTALSEIELAFQDVTDRNKIAYDEDTTFHDKIYSASWVQSLSGKEFPIQPYLKAGIGQMNREADGVYTAIGAKPPAVVDSVTGIVGGGLRLYFTRSLGMRSELTFYLTGGSVRTWKDNTSFTTGLSIFL